MEKEIIKSESLIACCGLYCGACRSYRNGRCPGCRENKKASWCKVRSCCKDKSIDNCSLCEEFPNPAACKKYNNFISMVIGFATGTSRQLCIEKINQIGYDGFITFMTENKFQSIPRKHKIVN